jgi:insulysin
MMIIPKNETRLFDTEILKNGIKTVYIYDKDIDKTTVTVSVNIGSYSNPKDFQGLAHFLEHMLFLGSKKYPDEKYYNNNIKKYGGFSNAWTDMFETVYYFSVFNDGIEHLMDIFSRFFIDPLFNEDAVQREINAVNSEHQKNINDDNWREYQTIRNLANKDNKWNTFATGSNKTMNKETIRNAMIKFYNQFYVSENISVCIVSNIDIKNQKNLLKSTFGNIPTKLKKEITIQKPIYNNFEKTFQMIPLSDIQKIKYIWEINSGFAETNKIYRIIFDLLNMFNKNSLSNFLKVNGLGDYGYINIEEEVGVFILTINLTKLGLTKLNLIDGYVNYTINNIFSKDLTKIIEYYRKINQLNFDNCDKMESLRLSNTLAINIHKYNLNELLSGPALIPNISLKINNTIKEQFSKCIKLLISQDNKIINKIIDKNYGTVYGEITNIYSPEIPFNLEFNIDNPFLDLKIQNNLKLVENLDTPIFIKNRFWFSGVTKFNEDIIKGALIFNNSKYFNTPKSYIYTVLAIECLTFYLNQELYNIFMLQFDISLSFNNIYNSIILKYSCLNDPIKLNQFIIKTLDLIKSAVIPNTILDSNIMLLKENYLNVNNSNPWEYSSYYMSSISIDNDYLIETLIKEIEKVNKKELLNFISTLFDNSSLSVLFCGALYNNHLPKNIQLIEKGILLPQYNFTKIELPENITLVHPNKEEKSNCVTITYELGNFEPNKWIHTFMTYLILEQPFFEELRTKKQLGYLVKFTLLNYGDNYYIVQKVQSDKNCKILLNEINNFNITIIDIINKINLDEWKISAKNYLNEKDNSLSDIFNKFFSEIINRKYLFNRKQILIQNLVNISIESLKNFITTYLLENNKKCIFQLNGN